MFFLFCSYAYLINKPLGNNLNFQKAEIKSAIYNYNVDHYSDGLCGFYFKITNAKLSSFPSNSLIQLILQVSVLPDNLLIYEKYFTPVIPNEDYFLNEIGCTFFAVPSFGQFNLVFYYKCIEPDQLFEKESEHSLIEIDQTSSNFNVNMNYGSNQKLSLDFKIEGAYYFINRTKPFRPGFNYFTKIPLDKRNYFIMRTKDNLNQVDQKIAFSELQSKNTNENCIFEGNNQVLLLTIQNVKFFNNQTNSINGKLKIVYETQSIDGKNESYIIYEKSFSAQKENGYFDPKIKDKEIKILNNEKKFTIKIVGQQKWGDGYFSQITYPCDEDPFFSIRNSTIYSNFYNVTISMQMIKETLVLFNLDDEYTNDNSLSLVGSFKYKLDRYDGYIQLQLPKNEKYVHFNLTHYIKELNGYKIYLKFDDNDDEIKKMESYYQDEFDFISFKPKNNIYKIDWNNNMTGVLFIRSDASHPKKVKIHYIVESNEKKALDKLDDHRKKVLKWVVIGSICLVVVICIIIVIVCVAKNC